jgi:hypothetical protein
MAKDATFAIKNVTPIKYLGTNIIKKLKKMSINTNTKALCNYITDYQPH